MGRWSLAIFISTRRVTPDLRAYDQEKGNQILASGQADLVSFATLFISNPDLARRFAVRADLNPPAVAGFYGQGDQNLEQGYTDYPVMV